jgi:hypothetical protein
VEPLGFVIEEMLQEARDKTEKTQESINTINKGRIHMDYKQSIKGFTSILIFRPKREFLIPRSGLAGSNGEKLDPLSASILS